MIKPGSTEWRRNGRHREQIHWMEAANDDVDEAYLEFYVDGEVILNECRQLGSFNSLVDKLSEVVRKFRHESDSTDNIVPIEELRPCVALEDDCLVMALDGVPNDHGTWTRLSISIRTRCLPISGM
ncbi:hypothetical protein RHMOL_Rhmol02G0146800 [Rhododendron molle]|uniref:Uncharacterized protein n=1 Tax=Rhododendron molle TaxID=49168 RepID=A0ACC0PQ92_RHOML|nr:hypothetical protein RHMOL_Rhmol02G0146800 [Rhododendron molle]